MTKDGTNPVGRLCACAVTVRQAPRSDFLSLSFSFREDLHFSLQDEIGFALRRTRGVRGKAIWNKLACRHKQVASACSSGRTWLKVSVLTIIIALCEGPTGRMGGTLYGGLQR